MNILIIEDDLMLQKALEFEFLQYGHQIFSATDGQKALDVVTKNTKMDLIICDIMMPVVSGPTFISLLKNFFFNSTPVIVISSLNQGDEILRRLGVEYDCFLQKPFAIPRLMELIKEFETTGI